MTEKRFLDRIEIPMRWSDMDAYGHANNSLYCDYTSEARAKWIRDAGHPPGGCQFLVTELHCKYKKSYCYPSIIVVDQYLENLQRCSFTLFYLLTKRDEPGVVYAECITKLACFDPISGKLCRVPEYISAFSR